MTQPPPSAQPPVPPPAPQYALPVSAAERVRLAWHGRAQSDYIFDFWTAFGWTILTCGVYGIYVIYQLVRRSRDHNLRRIELLDAATTFAWERASASGRTEELRPSFERIGAEMGVLRQKAAEFRDPTVFALISIVARGIVDIVAFILLDGDLVDHDRAEGAIEHELAMIYAALGVTVAEPDPARLKARHNYVGRVIASLATCGVYSLWWEYNVMMEGNAHFEHNWRWDDSLAAAVQQLSAA